MRVITHILAEVRNALILLLWGSGILWLAESGRLPTYLHPSLQPFTLGAGILLILMAGFLIKRLGAMRRETAHSCCCDHDEHGQSLHHEEHHHEEEGVFALLAKAGVLMVPVVLLIAGNTDRFTMATVANRGVVQDLSKLPAANSLATRSRGEPDLVATPSVTQSGKAMPLQVIDMLYALQMPSYREEFEGKEVEMVGQYVPMTTSNPRGDRFQAVRMFITCCAADAKPLGVTVRAEHLPKVSEMQWIRITGKPTFPMEGGKRAALLEATKVEPCEAPPDPFVY